MSTHIIYDLRVLQISGARKDTEDEPVYGLFVLGGASNSYEGWGVSARRSRSWGMIYSGSRSDLVAYAIDWANSFRGANTVWLSMGRSGCLKPQQWIRKVRNAIENSVVVEPDLLQASAASVGILHLQVADQFKGHSLASVFELVRKAAIEHPGSTMWQFLRVRGPSQ